MKLSLILAVIVFGGWGTPLPTEAAEVVRDIVAKTSYTRAEKWHDVLLYRVEFKSEARNLGNTSIFLYYAVDCTSTDKGEIRKTVVWATYVLRADYARPWPVMSQDLVFNETRQRLYVVLGRSLDFRAGFDVFEVDPNREIDFDPSKLEPADQKTWPKVDQFSPMVKITKEFADRQCGVSRISVLAVRDNLLIHADRSPRNCDAAWFLVELNSKECKEVTVKPLTAP